MASLSSASGAATKIGFWLLALTAIVIGVMGLRYVTMSPDIVPEPLRANFARNSFGFLIHTSVGAVALLTGIWQFLPAVRRRATLHRTLGRIYVPACLISAIAGFSIAWGSWAGTMASLGFAALAIAWFTTTSVGFVMARRRDFTVHPQWMARSYAVTCAAISFRLLIPLFPVFGMSFKASYALSTWLCWMINLAIVEALIRRGKVS